jgi:RsiW-degrading membrane proteinase PrsW (M82 family)
MFFHIYTWTILAAVVGIFLIAMLLMQNNKNNNNSHFDKRRIIWLLLAILLSIVVDISRVSLTGSSGGLEQDMEIAENSWP